MISPIRTGLAGPGLIGRAPRLFVIWSFAGVAIALAASALMSLSLGRLEGALRLRQAAGDASPEVWAIWLFVQAVDALISAASFAIPYCAVYRTVLRQGEHAFAGLRLGADEVRVGVVFLVQIAAFNSVLLAAVAFAAPFTVQPGLEYSSPAFYILAATVSVLLALPLVAWFAARTALIAPMTFATRRIAWREAWRLTRGHFWPLLGAVAIGWGIATLVVGAEALAGLWVAGEISGAGLRGGWNYVLSTDEMALAGLSDPARNAFLVIGSIASGAFYAAAAAPAAVAYRDLDPLTDVSETFA